MQLSSTDYQNESDVFSISPGWNGFFKDLMYRMEDENATNSPILAGDSSLSGNPDNYSWISIKYFQYQPETDRYLLLGTIPVTQVYGYDPSIHGTHILPDWDGTWYYLQDTADSSNSALVELSYLDTSKGDISKYSSVVDLIRNRTVYSTIMYSYYDNSTDWSRYLLYPIIRTPEGVTMTKRSGLTPGHGDRLKTYSQVSYGNNSESRREKIGDITLKGTVKVVEGMLPDGIYASTFFSDDGTAERRISDYEYIRIADKRVSLLNPDEVKRRESFENG
jgi:hypothetical protein